ncbi:MAG TPA: AmmeMemoRadiSam system protein A [Thermoanaerobaculia bacterium]|nr:AmmeMemoRadiSam system protein A [Thermoanaerobaculia bacterium]
MLTNEQQTSLLRIARESITRELDGSRLEIDVDLFDEALRRPAGAFVTLKTRDRQLRGCIGSVLPVSPLCRTVAANAVNAAFRDPRFSPLRRDELSAVGLEISVMGPVLPVRDLEEIVCGRDGLIVSRGSYAGLLLPQVASERGWDRETFLTFTCAKAGLDPDAWRSGVVKIDRFEAYVFGE